MSSAAHVYEGWWMNWDQERPRGARLTLSSSDGTILVSFIAIFVTICGGQMWAIIRFVLHQWRAGRIPSYALEEDQQVIIRNGTWAETFVEFAKLMRVYVRQGREPCYRNLLYWSVLVMVAASVNFVGWTIAGGFSSKVTQGLDDHLLISSPNCGFYTDISVFDSFTPATGFQARLQNSTRIADGYVQTCYNTSKSSNALCHRFVQQEIKWTTDFNASCPFSPGMCLGGDTAAFEMDTGPIDSHKTLGLNSARENRVLYRRKTTCAPLVTIEPYAELIPGKLPGEEYALYHYGDIANSLNYTYRVSTYAQLGSGGYILSGIVAPGGFTPIPEITRDDAEVSIFFLEQNTLAYTAEVDDLFFSSHTNPTPLEVAPGDTNVLYYHDKLVSVMGCIDQHQICNPVSLRGPRCSALSSANISQSELEKLEFNQFQNDTAYVIQQLIIDGEILNSISGRGAAALKAQKTVFDNINIPLPNNQWTIEVGSWLNVALARLQHAILEYSTGPAYTDFERYQRSNLTSLSRIYRNTCGIQKVRQFNFNDKNLSFSVVALVIIFVVGGIVILISLFLERTIGRLQDTMGWGRECQVDWKRHDKLRPRHLPNGGIFHAAQASPPQQAGGAVEGFGTELSVLQNNINNRPMDGFQQAQDESLPQVDLSGRGPGIMPPATVALQCIAQHPIRSQTT